MLKRSLRLTSAKFLEVIQKGKFVASPLFSIQYLSGQKNTRVSVIASKKEGKTATARNKIRRRGYEAVMPITHLIKPGTHLVLFMKAKTATVEFKDLKKEVEGFFVKIGIVKKG